MARATSCMSVLGIHPLCHRTLKLNVPATIPFRVQELTTCATRAMRPVGPEVLELVLVQLETGSTYANLRGGDGARARRNVDRKLLAEGRGYVHYADGENEVGQPCTRRFQARLHSKHHNEPRPQHPVRSTPVNTCRICRTLREYGGRHDSIRPACTPREYGGRHDIRLRGFLLGAKKEKLLDGHDDVF